ncbi:MAG TPA: flagellar basal body-associated FliL family protein [Candidatus Wallbacteria bacterium]|nr:MAG: flagellar basal body-associated protein FliL [bacterium ADurb.Bin243]HOD42600.1 flagellar basal body-associated FliL family protein [Candidatus Wallbacteria bacterium]HPG56291.1 flagellar basal body-associated FliL family protein [Candidatus Wallbacteria bacterium]
MSEGESRFPLKLIIAGAAVIGLIVLSVGGYFAYTMLMKGGKPAAPKVNLEKLEFESKDNVTFEEFTVYLVEGDEKGMIKFKVNAEVASTKVKEFLERKKPAVRDIVTRRLMAMKIEDIKQKYYNLKLHDMIKDDLNVIVDSNVKGNTGENAIKMNLVVKVNVFDFSAVSID